MSRTTLAHLILDLRSMTDAGTADYYYGTAQFWDDDQMQIILDSFRTDIRHEQLVSYQEWVSAGSVDYLLYASENGNLEETVGGTAILYLEDAQGVNVSAANYTPDYRKGQFTFTTTTGGSVFYLTARAYDVYAAAAEIWRRKASYFATRAIDFRSDNHSINQSQMVKHCQAMAMEYDSRSLNFGSSFHSMIRGDDNNE